MNLTCFFRGHEKKRVASDWLYRQKGQREKEYFSGVYLECQRPGCAWTAFFGERRAHSRSMNVNGQERFVVSGETVALPIFPHSA